MLHILCLRFKNSASHQKKKWLRRKFVGVFTVAEKDQLVDDTALLLVFFSSNVSVCTRGTVGWKFD